MENYVYGRARLRWRGTPTNTAGIRLTLIYLCDDSPADIDNIIKPIQDGLVGVVFADDFQVTDVDSHRRFLSEQIDVTNLPRLLIEGAALGVECVYIRITPAQELEYYL